MPLILFSSSAVVQPPVVDTCEVSVISTNGVIVKSDVVGGTECSNQRDGYINFIPARASFKAMFSLVRGHTPPLPRHEWNVGVSEGRVEINKNGNALSLMFLECTLFAVKLYNITTLNFNEIIIP